MSLLFFLPLTLPGLFLGISMLVFFARIDFKLSLVTVVLAHLVYAFPYFLLIAVAALDRLDLRSRSRRPTSAPRRGSCSGG